MSCSNVYSPDIALIGAGIMSATNVGRKSVSAQEYKSAERIVP